MVNLTELGFTATEDAREPKYILRGVINKHDKPDQVVGCEKRLKTGGNRH
jgi:hypothetical protein